MDTLVMIFDTETSGFSNSGGRLIQLAYNIHTLQGKLIKQFSEFVTPFEGLAMSSGAYKVHGISLDHLKKNGIQLSKVLQQFLSDLQTVKYVVGHNVKFDEQIMNNEFLVTNHLQNKEDTVFEGKTFLDTMMLSKKFCDLYTDTGRPKQPKLIELYIKLFGVPFEAAHDAGYDVHATAQCFFQLIQIGVIEVLELKSIDLIQYEAPQLKGPASIQPQDVRSDLNVPFTQKDEAKKLGAKWDPIKKVWYAPNSQQELLEKWGIINLKIENISDNQQPFKSQKEPELQELPQKMLDASKQDNQKQEQQQQKEQQTEQQSQKIKEQEVQLEQQLNELDINKN